MITVELELHEGIAVGIAVGGAIERCKSEHASGALTLQEYEMISSSLASAYLKIGAIVDRAVTEDESDGVMELG